jgi:hypothetical protein
MRVDSLREDKSFSSQTSRSIVSNGHGILYPEIKRLVRQFEHALPPNSLLKVGFRNFKNKTENKISFLLL